LNTSAGVSEFSMRVSKARPMPEEQPVMMIQEKSRKKLSMVFLSDIVRFARRSKTKRTS
jgi:hypothetical protein